MSDSISGKVCGEVPAVGWQRIDGNYAQYRTVQIPINSFQSLMELAAQAQENSRFGRIRVLALSTGGNVHYGLLEKVVHYSESPNQKPERDIVVEIIEDGLRGARVFDHELTGLWKIIYTGQSFPARWIER